MSPSTMAKLSIENDYLLSLPNEIILKIMDEIKADEQSLYDLILAYDSV